jgi:hypothetical protein
MPIYKIYECIIGMITMWEWSDSNNNNKIMIVSNKEIIAPGF